MSAHTPQRLPRPAACADARGLTLVEMVIALAILTLLVGSVVVAMDNVFGANAKKAAGELAAQVRAMYQEAALSGRTCRMTFKLPEDPASEKVVYLTECAEGAVATGRDRDVMIKESNQALKDEARGITQRASRDFKMVNDAALQNLFAQEQDRAAGRGFSEYTPEGSGKNDLPSNVRIEVWTRGQKEPVKSGIAWLYFHPQGYTERAMIYILQGNNAWTIKVSPLTGKTEVVATRLPVPKS